MSHAGTINAKAHAWREEHDREVKAIEAGLLKWPKPKSRKSPKATLGDWRARLGASAWMLGTGKDVGGATRGPGVGELVADWKARKRRERK